MKIMNKENGKKLLLEFANWLDEFEIPFFLIQGTALGAYRDKEFTPTEQDIDLGYLVEDLPEAQFHDFCFHLLEQRYEIQTFNLPFTRPRMMTVRKYGCKIDFTGYLKWKDKRFATRTHDERELPELTMVHDAEIFEDCDTIELFGRTFRLPNLIVMYLKLTYGKECLTVKNGKHALMKSSVCISDWIKNEKIPLDLLEK